MNRFTHSVRRWMKPTQISILSLLCIISLSFPGGALAMQSQPPAGETIYALMVGNHLLQFSSDDACTMTSRQKIKGLQPGEKLEGIDFRPFNGQLYGLGSTSRLYTIDIVSGVATQIGTPFTVALNGTAFGFDFNPAVDRIRVVSNTGQNLRLHPDTGAVVAVDTSLAYAPTDVNAGASPSVTAAAYTNPDTDPATGTTLYDIDTNLNILVTQVPPNNGVLNTIGSLGVDVRKPAGFDISISGTAYASLQTGTGGCGPTKLATIDLATGTATLVSGIGTAGVIRDIAVQIVP